MSSKCEGFAVSARLLMSVCPHFPVFDNTEGALFFKHSNHFAFRSEPVLSRGSRFFTAGDVKKNPRAPAMKVYRFSFPLDTRNEGTISGGWGEC